MLSCSIVPVFFNYFDGSCLFFTRSICYPAAWPPCHLRVALSLHPFFPAFCCPWIHNIRLWQLCQQFFVFFEYFSIAFYFDECYHSLKRRWFCMTENERVKEVRKTLNLTLKKFGERIGVTRGSMSNIENGNRNLTEQMTKSCLLYTSPSPRD